MREYFGMAASERNVFLPLTGVLARDGIFAHEGCVSSTAWSSSRDVLASAGFDGYLNMWNVGENQIIVSRRFEEAILYADFSFSDRFLVVQTPERIIFLTADSLEVVWEEGYPSLYDPQSPLASCRMDAASESHIAVAHHSNPDQLLVCSVDYEALVGRTKGARRKYRAAGISVLGEAGSGRTTLLHALAGQDFSNEHRKHGLSIYRVPLPEVTVDAYGATEGRELALWDPPSHVGIGIVHDIHACDCNLTIVALRPAPGAALLAAENLAVWKRCLARLSPPKDASLCRFIVAVTHADEIFPEPTRETVSALSAALGVPNVLLLSARMGHGIAGLRDNVFQMIDWPSAVCFESWELLIQLSEYAAELRKQRRFLLSAGEFRESFLRSHLVTNEDLASEEHIRQGLRILELRGELYLFASSDAVILDPTFYRTYASALVDAASRDAEEMGRLPLIEASMGVGKQMKLEQSAQLPSPRDHKRLLDLVIDEVLAGGLAQTVSTDGVFYLVFPKSLSRTREDVNRPAMAAMCKVSGAIDDTFSSLIVRLLGQQIHYPSEKLWRHEAMFVPATGGACTVRIEPASTDSEATIGLYFDDGTSAIEKSKFFHIVRQHIEQQPNIILAPMEWLEPDKGTLVPTEIGASRRTDSLEVIVSWRRDSDARTEHSALAIIKILNESGIDVISGRRLAGVTAEEFTRSKSRVKVAVFLLAKRPIKDQLTEFSEIESSGARIIPVILPNAAPSFSLPREFRRWGHLDFRGKFLDVDELRLSIVNAWEAGTIEPAPASGHVFISYFHDDTDQVSELSNAIQSAGHNVWWDKGRSRLPAGAQWEFEIEEAIRSSYAFLVCLSERAKDRSWVFRELSVAAEIQMSYSKQRAFIVPVRLSDCDIASFLRLNAGLKMNLQYVDYFGRNRSTNELVSTLDKARDASVASRS